MENLKERLYSIYIYLDRVILYLKREKKPPKIQIHPHTLLTKVSRKIIILTYISNVCQRKLIDFDRQVGFKSVENTFAKNVLTKI